MRALNITSKRIGGLTFVRIGRLSFSFCITARRVHKLYVAGHVITH